jgi:soluble lytic murein transglycosylase-like protein
MGQWQHLAKASASKWAARYNIVLPYQLVEAIIQVESSGRPQAKRTEPDGRVSRGLMQLLDGTAEWLGFPKGDAMYDPGLNVDAGTKYLAWQIDRYKGDLMKAIAAYNSGTAQWNRKGVLTNENYVRKVMTAWKGSAGFGAAQAIGSVVVGIVALLAIAKGRLKA